VTLPAHVAANPLLSRWIEVGSDGVVALRVGKVELGQGIVTALAQVAADELDVDLDHVRSPPANTETGPDEGVTAGSLSVVEAGPAVRLVAATTRALFVAEAARRWGLDPALDHEQVTVDRGVICGPGGRVTSYAELAGDVDLDVLVDDTTPVRGVRRVSGTSAPRIDLPDKVAGRPRFVHDLRLPGQLYGRVVRPASPGAVLVAVDPAATAGLDVQVVRDGSFVGAVGEREADVVRAVEMLQAATTWDERDTLPDEDDLDAYLRAGPHEVVPVVDDDMVDDVDDDASGPPPAGQVVRATYSRPFLAHASMAPSCAVAWWQDDGRLAVWSHSQGIHPLRDAIVAALSLDADSVTVEHTEGAGCYGHNAADDAAFDAVLLARAVPGRPVQVQWSRHDELAWSPFGSAMTADVEAGVGDDGRLTSWSYDVFSQGHSSRPGYAGVPGLLAATHLSEPAAYPAATDPPADRGAGSTRNALPLYDLPRRRIRGHRLTQTPLRSSAMRALGAHLNVFAIESFMDEVALTVGRDPLELRLAHLSDERGRHVLQRAAAAAGWGGPTPEGVGRGLGFARYKNRGAWCAVVAEVEAEHEIRVRRLTVCVDVGEVLNPDGVRNQIEGGATQSTSWTTRERVRFDRRKVTSTDWESYPILRFADAPHVDVEIVDRPGEPALGAGEAAQGPTAAAIANAVADAIGVRVRNLPLTSEAVVAAIESDS